nr:imidazole glycerol phosphate synthase subunit HisH [Coralloluteibacterium stylophorae]
MVLVDSGGANLGSVQYALQRLGIDAPLVSTAAEIEAAERVILPGVGAAGPAMARLRELDLVGTIRGLRTPLLGVCVGMQILFEASEEGGVDCLGLLPGRVRRLPQAPGVRVPHMGWNRVQPHADSALLAGIDAGAWAYYVHSFAAPVTADCIAASVHGEPFAAVVARGNVAGAQFHPERSAAVGARLLQNFMTWRPE